MKCKHENVTGRAWSESYPRWYCEFASTSNDPIADALICDDCSAWLSLGPSNDTDERVAVEIKLAAHIQEVCILWEPKDQNELIGWYVDGFASQAISKDHP